MQENIRVIIFQHPLPIICIRLYLSVSLSDDFSTFIIYYSLWITNVIIIISKSILTQEHFFQVSETPFLFECNENNIHKLTSTVSN